MTTDQINEGGCTENTNTSEPPQRKRKREVTPGHCGASFLPTPPKEKRKKDAKKEPTPGGCIANFSEANGNKLPNYSPGKTLS